MRHKKKEKKEQIFILNTQDYQREFPKNLSQDIYFKIAYEARNTRKQAQKS